MNVTGVNTQWMDVKCRPREDGLMRPTGWLVGIPSYQKSCDTAGIKVLISFPLFDCGNTSKYFPQMLSHKSKAKLLPPFTRCSHSWLTFHHLHPPPPPPPRRTRAVCFHSSTVQIGYCLWCVILKADSGESGDSLVNRLNKLNNRSKRVLLMLWDTRLPQHNKGTFVLYLWHHRSLGNIDDPGQKLCMSKKE